MSTGIRLVVAALAIPPLLTACVHDDDNGDDQVSYEVRVTNLTAAQPLSPPAYVFHRDGYTGWQAGAAAAEGLERLAEGGDPDAFLETADASTAVTGTAAGDGAIPPGASGSALVDLSGRGGLHLTVATMLVNTNDAFAGLDSADIASLGVQESATFDVAAWDAGTEANGETAASIPGPAAGGEGYNPERDDTDRVSVHAGVVSGDDGLASSTLDERHRFDNPVARVTVTRLQ